MIRLFLASGLSLLLSTCPTLVGGEPVDGYAVLEGTVLRSDGRPLQGGVFVMCGRGSPSGFGVEARTNGEGLYRREVRAPDGGYRPDGAATEFELVCRVSAPADFPPVAQAVRTVRFASRRGDRSVTRIDLVEGRVE